MTPVLDVSELRKTYRSRKGGSTVAVAGLDLTVNQGEVHGFLGPNGSGKTTTLRILLGLAHADGGHMRIFGETVPQGLPRVIDRIGAIVESPRFFGHFTGRKTLSLLAGTIGLPVGRVDEVLELVGLRERGEEQVKGYSLGMRQRLAVASALLKQPQLLILDEPTNGLDPAGIREMRELMRRLASTGVTVLVSSHLLSEVEQLCDTMTIVSRGRQVTSGRVDEILAEHATKQLRVRLESEASLSDAQQILVESGFAVDVAGDRLIIRNGAPPAAVTKALADEQVYLTELVGIPVDLETVFLRLTGTEPVDGTYPQVNKSYLPDLPGQVVSDNTVSVVPLPAQALTQEKETHQ
ncbi:ABC transporter ATP-binding protein [Stackebrandtia soli]|uniref:ABC transporter ATP-binding protein n=1 Tax=Stackebrandtia soli TaxID=1892856 RepID=UPI0039EBFF2C